MTNKKHPAHTSQSSSSSELLKSPKKQNKWLLIPFAALFALFGLVIIIRSFASTPGFDANDVLHNGFSTASEKTAQDEVILKLNNGGTNPGAKALFAKFGITDTEIRAAKLVPGFNPHNSSYDNWYSFGRTNFGKPDTHDIVAGGVHFYAKPVKYAWAAAATVTQPTLKGKTKDGRVFLIHAECGNLVMPGLTPFQASPHATITKQAVSPAAKSNVKPGDVIKYRLTAKSDGNTDAYVTIADAIPTGTTFVSGDVETGNALPLAVETQNNQKIYKWANYNLSKGSIIKILVTVKVDAGTKDGFCNVAYLTWVKGQTPPAKSEVICHNIVNGSPILKVDKEATDVKAGSQVKPGDVITYKVTGQNKGTANSTAAAIWDGVQDKGWFDFVEMGPLMRANQAVPAAEISDTVMGKQSNDYKYWGYTLKTMKPNDVVSFTIKFKVRQAENPALKVCDLAIIADSRPSPFGVWGYDEVCHSVEGVEKHKSAIFTGRKDSAGKPLVADGKNVAKAGDEIQYTLTTKNLGTKALAGYQIDEDINDILEYADITDNGGATLSNGILTWKANIASGKTDTKMFKVKVKTPIPNLSGKTSSPSSYDYKMVNIYGDTVTIPVDKPIIQTVIDTLPQTGALGMLMIPLVLAAGMLLLYTSGVFGRGRTKQGAAAHQVATTGSATIAHSPGEQFKPNDQTKDEPKHKA